MEVPSLVVFFFDLDWDEAQWEEKETECASKIQVIRYVVLTGSLLVEDHYSIYTIGFQG